MSRAARLTVAALVLAGGLVADVAVVQAGEQEAAVFRCLYQLPGVACQIAGVASDPVGGELWVFTCAASSTTSPSLASGAGTTPAGTAYCNGRTPPAPLAGGALLLGSPAAAAAPVVAHVPIDAGFGGAAWAGENEIWTAMYSNESIGRLRVDLEHPENGEMEALLAVPGGGRIGGLAFDGERLYVHQTKLDVILVLDSSSGDELNQLPVPLKAAVNGLAYLDGRLFAAINDDNMTGTSTGHGPAQEAIVALDPATGEELARWNLPAGIYPHSMDRFSGSSLSVVVQTQAGPLAPMYLWEFVLPPGGGSGMNNPVTIEPCS